MTTHRPGDRAQPEKGTGGPLQQITRSSAFGEVIRAAIAFEHYRNENDQLVRVMSQAKNNLARARIYRDPSRVGLGQNRMLTVQLERLGHRMQRQVFMGEGRNGAATQLVGVDLRDKSDHHAVVTVPVIGEADTR